MFNARRNELRVILSAGALVFGLSACDAIQQKLGIEAPAAKAARLEGEGKAVGGACRQSGRAIEDCYSIYSWLPKAAIYEGWRDMDVYMRENKLETVAPQLPPPQPPGTKKKKADPAAGSESGGEKPLEGKGAEGKTVDGKGAEEKSAKDTEDKSGKNGAGKAADKH